MIQVPTVPLLTFKKQIVQCCWVDAAILNVKNPVLWKFQLEKEFPTEQKAKQFAKRLVKSGKCYGGFCEVWVTDRLNWGAGVTESTKVTEVTEYQNFTWIWTGKKMEQRPTRKFQYVKVKVKDEDAIPF